MDVVINRSYGGFGLSHKAMMRYAELKGITLIPYFEDSHREESFDTPGAWVCYNLIKEDGTSEYFSDIEIGRNDPLLVKVVRELGQEAGNRFARLKIVRVPKNVKWHIEEYDGMEHVAEDYRTWL